MSEQKASSLLEKLDAFIRKYYTNRMIRGVLYSVGLILAFYLVAAVMEGIGHFNRTLRTLLFWGFTSASLYLLIRHVAVPLLKLFKLGKTLSYKEASLIVGNHFPEVKDKLINTLQLQERSGVTGSDSLLLASIDQRTRELTPVPFTAAIDLRENKRYLVYVLPPVVILGVLLFAAPSLLTESTDRLIRYNEEIVPLAPFQITLDADGLQVAEREDYLLNVAVEGAVVPEKIYIEIGGTRFLMNADDKRNFSHVFRSVESNQAFRFYADGFYFGPYTLTVLPKPMLVNFSVNLDYPKYTGLSAETVSNTGDLTIPEGTRITWQFNTRNTETLRLALGDSVFELRSDEGSRYMAQAVAKRSGSYSLTPENQHVGSSDSMVYRMNVVADRHPSIRVTEQADSLTRKDLFFTGEVQDDYGFQRLVFHYAFTASDRADRKLNTYERIVLPMPSGTADRFFYNWSLGNLGLTAGEELEYYFEVWDNDGVNGSKATRSMMMTFAAPTLDELREERDQESEDIKDKLEESLDETRELQRELDELRRDLLNKEELGWQEKQKLEKILERQKALQQQVEAAQQKNEQKNQRQESFEQPNESLQQKQEKLQELMEQVMTDELKQLYDEIQKLMEELNKEELQQQMEEMEMSAEDMEKELDRALEQFKQLEFEQKMTETIDEMKKLAEEQEKLAEESQKENADTEELKKEQDALNERFEELKDDLKKLEELNQELEEKNNIPDTQEQQEQIEQEMEKSSDQLDKKKSKKASESQKSAAEKMQEMAEQMEQAMADDAEAQAEEDMEALRALLENIITLSFDQEELMNNFAIVDKNDPKYVAYGQVQRKLKDDAKMVEDSLFALSKRVIQLEAIVNREIGQVNHHMAEAIEGVGERRTDHVRMNQQYVMTSFNNLALLLDEALQQMQQQQMQNKKPGEGSCNKPGGNGSPKPSAGEMKKMQEGLSKQLEKMKEQMGKDGNKGKNNSGQQGQMSKQLAEMAAKQAAIRQMMDRLAQDLNQDGSGNGNELKQISREMEKVEEDIVNKRITQETLERQQDIMIRLLKAENAERTREQDEKRKSRSGNPDKTGTPPSLELYLREKERETELLRTVPPSLKPYYRDKVNDYFNNLDR